MPWTEKLRPFPVLLVSVIFAAIVSDSWGSGGYCKPSNYFALKKHFISTLTGNFLCKKLKLPKYCQTFSTMNLLRPTTIDSAGNERNNDVFHHYKTLKWKISENQGKISLKLCMSDIRIKVSKLIHQITMITHCYYVISGSDIISSSSFIVPREKRNFFVTRYVQVLFDLNSTKQAQFTAPLVSGL